MIITAKAVYVMNSSKCFAWIMYLLFSLYSCTITALIVHKKKERKKERKEQRAI